VDFSTCLASWSGRDLIRDIHRAEESRSFVELISLPGAIQRAAGCLVAILQRVAFFAEEMHAQDAKLAGCRSTCAGVCARVGRVIRCMTSKRRSGSRREIAPAIEALESEHGYRSWRFCFRQVSQ